MHRDDEMTSNERLNAFFEGKEVDHLPAMPFLDSIGCKVAGMTHREKRRSPENTAKAQIACYERFGNDGMSIEYGLHGIGAACGSAMSDPENGAPAVVKHCLHNLDDIRELDIECVSKKRDPWAKLHYEAMEICQEAMGTRGRGIGKFTGTVYSSGQPLFNRPAFTRYQKGAGKGS